jgi:inner membrane protein
MMTKEGVPLLYPFNNNPCVIPGNPDRRLQSGNFKTETIIFCLLIPIGISCKSLFENGFWTTFDRTFGNLKNINYEFRESPQLIKLTYEASYLGKKYQGQGYIVSTTPYKAIIFNQNEFLEINKNFQITKLLPTKTSTKYKTKDLAFQDLTLDSLQQLIHNKPLLECHIQANSPIRYTKDNKVIISPQVDLTYTYNPPLIWEQKEDLALTVKKQALEHKLQILQREKFVLEEQERSIQDRIQTLIHTTSQMGPYSRQKAMEELKNLKKQLETLTIQQYSKKIEGIQFRLSQLKAKPNPICSGYLQYLVLHNYT